MVGKNLIERARAPWINVIVNYCCTRALLHAKMLKETETEKAIVFFVTVLPLVAIQLGGLGPPWLRLRMNAILKFCTLAADVDHVP